MAATKPAFTPPGKKGDMIFSALVKLAALIVLLKMCIRDRVVARARKIQRFLSQPFFVAEVFTGSPGKYVALKDTIPVSYTHLDVYKRQN